MQKYPPFNLSLNLPKFCPCLILAGSQRKGFSVPLSVLVGAIHDVPSASLRDTSHNTLSFFPLKDFWLAAGVRFPFQPVSIIHLHRKSAIAFRSLPSIATR